MLHCQVLTFVYMFTNHFVLNFIHSFTINCFMYCIVLFSHFPKNTKFPNTIVNTVYFNLLTNINPFLNILPSTLLFTFWICVKSKEGIFCHTRTDRSNGQSQFDFRPIWSSVFPIPILEFQMLIMLLWLLR